MPNTAERLMSLDEFLAWEREQPERYEYAGGAVTMMTGGPAAHVTIALNLAMALRHALRDTGCRPFGSDMKVIAYDTARYPDVSVTCRPVGDRDDNISHPVLVIEVISPSTEQEEDRGRKKFDYFATPSIQQYANIEQDARRVDLYTRSGDRWTDEIIEGDAILKLSSIGVEISLDTMYEDTELDTTRPRENGSQAPVL
jgi:Uma2 family endonuclease